LSEESDDLENKKDSPQNE
jgi:hypothetical protein